MKSRITRTAILSITAFLSLSLGSKAQNINSILWEISGKNLKQPSYVYGTIHIQDERVFSFDSTVWEKFISCDAFAMEVILDETEPEAMKNAITMKNSLKEMLKPEDYKALDSALKTRLGMGAIFFDKVKPFFIASQLMQSDMKADGQPLDMFLLSRARNMNMKTFGIEKFEDQIAAVDKMDLEEQCTMLVEMIRDTAQSTGDEFEKLVAAYLAQDLKKITNISEDSTLPENFNKAFLVDRNKKMAKSIIRFGKKQSTFNAIGAAHLIGDYGVLELIRKKGYTVKPVIFKFESLPVE